MERKHLPDTRSGITVKNQVGGMKFYVTVNFYDDCPLTPGEVFIIIAKEGSTLGGLCEALAVTISLALQFGVPWEALSRKYRYSKFDPYDDKYTSLISAVADTVDNIVATRKDLYDDSHDFDDSNAPRASHVPDEASQSS